MIIWLERCNHVAKALIVDTSLQKTILNKIQSDHDKAKTQHRGLPNGANINIKESKTILLTYSIDKSGVQYWLNSFPHDLPLIQIWDYSPGKGSKSIRGYESESHRENQDYCMDWFYNSGGQLKWYPKISSSEYSFGPYRLEPIPPGNVIGNFQEAAKKAFGGKWDSTKHPA